MTSADRIDGQLSRGAELKDRLTRGLAASVLVASILPVVLLGPSLLRAPLKLGRELHADVQRLLAPRSTRPRARAGHLTPRTGLASPR
jgi:hypothetical protein